MKYLSLLAVSILLFVGCGEKKSGTTSSVSADKFVLEYKYEEGKTYNYKLISENQNSVLQEAKESKKIEQSEKLEYLFELKIENVEEDGTMNIAFNVKEIKVSLNSPEKKITHNIGKDKDTAKLFTSYESLVNNPFNVRIAKNGEILDVTKLEGIIKKMNELEGNKEVSAEEKEKIKIQLSSTLVRPMVGQLIREFPNKSMAKDSSWTKNQAPSQSGPFQMLNTATYKIEEVKDNGNGLTAKINSGLASSFLGDRNISQGGANYNFEEPKIEANGTIYYNVENGYLQSLQNQVHFNMTFSATANGQKIRQVSEQTSKTTIKLLD